MAGIILVIGCGLIWLGCLWAWYNWRTGEWKADAIYWVEERRRLQWVKVFADYDRSVCQTHLEQFQNINPDYEYRITYE